MVADQEKKDGHRSIAPSEKIRRRPVHVSKGKCFFEDYWAY